MPGARSAAGGPITVLFGTSANPPTGLRGHAGLVRWAAALKEVPELGGASVGAVWVLPVYQHAYASKRGMPAFSQRLQLARLAFEEEPQIEGRVEVRADERAVHEACAREGRRPGTIDLVDRLRAAYPERRFCLLLGADTYADLKAHRWRQSERLLSELPILVVPREGEPLPPEAVSRPPALSELSSTAVRQSKSAAFLRRVLQPQVLAFLRAEGLYHTAEIDWGEG